MKAQVLQESLHQALRMIAWALPGKSLIESVNGILLRVVNERVEVSATDLAVYATASCLARVEEHGVYLVSGAHLLETVANMNQERILLSGPVTRITLQAGRSRAIMTSMHWEDFPEQPIEGSVLYSCSIQVDLFLKAIRAVSFAAIRDPRKTGAPILLGINLQFENDTIKLAACDSNRAAYSTVQILSAETSTTTPNITVPAEGLETATRMLASEPKTIMRLQIEKTRIRLSLEGIATYTIQLLNGIYPDVRRLIPTVYGTSATMSPKKLLEVVRFAKIYQNDSTTMQFAFEDNTLQVTTQNEGLGESEHSLDIKMTGAPMKIELNSAFVMDYLETVQDHPTIEARLQDATKPILFNDGATKDENCYLCMPIFREKKTEGS